MAVVMVVDDTESARTVLVKLLRREGFETHTASSAEEALAALADAEPPDVMLLDISMPQMDGMSLLEILHNDPRWASLPVIMVSGLSGEPWVEQARRLGAKAYVVKGRESFDELLGHIRRYAAA